VKGAAISHYIETAALHGATSREGNGNSLLRHRQLVVQWQWRTVTKVFIQSGACKQTSSEQAKRVLAALFITPWHKVIASGLTCHRGISGAVISTSHYDDGWRRAKGRIITVSLCRQLRSRIVILTVSSCWLCNAGGRPVGSVMYLLPSNASKGEKIKLSQHASATGAHPLAQKPSRSQRSVNGQLFLTVFSQTNDSKDNSAWKTNSKKCIGSFVVHSLEAAY